MDPHDRVTETREDVLPTRDVPPTEPAPEDVPLDEPMPEDMPAMEPVEPLTAPPVEPMPGEPRPEDVPLEEPMSEDPTLGDIPPEPRRGI